MGSSFYCLLLLLIYNSILTITATPNPTPSPIVSTKSLCGTQTATTAQWCYYVDIYPMQGIETTDTVLITNADDIKSTYFDINIKANGNDCIRPTIDFVFEDIDFAQSSEYLQVLREDGTEIKKCTGSKDNNCGHWISCFTDTDLGDVTQINKGITYRITIYETNINDLCGPYSIHSRLTIKCAASPTNNPTTTNGMEETQIIRKKKKIEIDFEFGTRWLWILLIISSLCIIICACILLCFCKKRHGVIYKHDTKTFDDDTIPMEYDGDKEEEVECSMDDDDDDDNNNNNNKEEKKADQLAANLLTVKAGNNNPRMHNKSVMDMIDIINHPSKLKADVIMDDEEIKGVYDDDSNITLQSDHDIEQTMIVKVTPPISQYSETVETSSYSHNMHYQRHNIPQTMIIKPSPPNSQKSETVETMNTVHAKPDNELYIIHELVNNTSNNSKHDMSDTNITETYQDNRTYGL